MDEKKEAAPAAAEGDAHGHATPKGKKGSLIKFLILGVVLGGAGLGAFLFLGHKSKAAEPEKTAEPAATAAGEKRKTQVVTLKPIVVNLRNSKGTRYLKVTVGM